MRILTQRDEVLGAMDDAQQQGCPLFCPNAETPDEMQGLLLGAMDFRQKAGINQVVIGMGITSSYPDHPQLQRLSLGESQDMRPTLQTWLAWLKVHADRPGHFDGIAVIPFLDHGWAPDAADMQLMLDEQVQQQLGIIMFDASAFALSENIKLTADYVQQAGKRVVVEACPDKILSEAEILAKGLTASDMLTDPLPAAQFVKQTGVDLIVPNLGTEHRATGHHVQYHADLARQLKAQVGTKLALHGTSSLGDRVNGLAADGIIKVNFYTAMARAASQQLRDLWHAIPDNEPLPITRSCGSEVLGVRRQRVRQVALKMLYRLQTGMDTQ